MAGYPRKLLSLELALKNIIKDLKKDEIKVITGKVNLILENALMSKI